MQPIPHVPPTPPSTTGGNDAILAALTTAIWKVKWRVLAFAGTCTLAAAAASYIEPKRYEATLLLSPVTSQSNSGGLGALTSAVSQLGGIASLGMSMNAGGGAKAESLATLESEVLTERFIKENNLLPVLFHRQWDSHLNRWKSDHTDGPTLWVGNRYFAKTVRATKETARTGLVTLTITWTDPVMAANWANGLVKMANDFLREKSIRESERNIAYLNEQLGKTSVVEIRNSIYNLMESEIKKQMMARGSDEFALKVIDPAVAPEKSSSPQRLLWALAGLCMGLLLSIIYIFLRLTLTFDPTRSDA